MADMDMSQGATKPGSVSGASSIDKRYMVTLTVAGEGGEAFVISTTLDETLAISMSSQWAAPFENVMQEALGAGVKAAGKLPGKAGAVAGVVGRSSGAGNAAAQTLGIAVKYKASSFQTWQSSDPMHFTIPFTLVALDDPVKDIKEKVVKLLKLVAPTELGPILKAPGPTLLDSVTGGRKITLEIGQFIKLEPCVITDVQVQFDNVIGEAGIPLRAKINVDIKSWRTCFTTTDIDQMFAVGGG